MSIFVLLQMLSGSLISFRLDRHDHFKNPVSRHDVPDYFDVIKRPMCWEVIDAKLDHHQYWDLQNFLVCDLVRLCVSKD